MNFADPEVVRITRKKLLQEAIVWADGYIPHLQAEYLPEGARHLLMLRMCAQRELTNIKDSA